MSWHRGLLHRFRQVFFNNTPPYGGGSFSAVVSKFCSGSVSGGVGGASRTFVSRATTEDGHRRRTVRFIGRGRRTSLNSVHSAAGPRGLRVERRAGDQGRVVTRVFRRAETSQSRECFSGGSWKQRIDSVEAIERKLIFSFLGLEIKDNVAWAVAAGCAPAPCVVTG